MTDSINNKNAKLARNLALIAIGMFGFGYALVPIYDVLCELTGLNGKVAATAAQEMPYVVDKNREITVEFMTALNETTPLNFRAETKAMKIHPGEYYTVNFFAENKTDIDRVARAIFSVSPGLAVDYVKKIECFCDTQQTFKAREQKTMKVRFAINPKLPEEYKTITLAYTFFDNTDLTVK